MEKMGSDSPAECQLCFAHAIHLAEVDLIYKKQDDYNNVNDKDLEIFISSVMTTRVKIKLLSKLLIFLRFC